MWINLKMEYSTSNYNMKHYIDYNEIPSKEIKENIEQLNECKRLGIETNVLREDNMESKSQREKYLMSLEVKAIAYIYSGRKVPENLEKELISTINERVKPSNTVDLGGDLDINDLN